MYEKKRWSLRREPLCSAHKLNNVRNPLHVGLCFSLNNTNNTTNQLSYVWLHTST